MELITVTPQDLRALIGAEVRAALSEVTPPPPKYLTLAQAADILQMSVAGVRKWVLAGHLPAQTFGKVTRVKRTDLDALLAGQTPRR